MLTPPSGPADRGQRSTAPGGLRSRLRRFGAAGNPPMSIPLPNHDAATVDQAVRTLAAACSRADRALAAVLAVIVGPDTVRLRLATPDERPPTGWSAEHDGRTWQADLGQLPGATPDEPMPEAYRRLVSLGATADGHALLNLGQARGIVSLDGDPRHTQALVRAWAMELTTNPWTQGVRVIRVGFEATTGDSAQCVDAERLADAEPALADPDGGVLLLADPPTGTDAERIQTLADDPARPWSVVVAGPVEDARWRFTVDPSGKVDTELLDGASRYLPDPSARAAVPSGADTGERASDAATNPTGQRWRHSNRPRLALALVASLCLLAVAVLALQHQFRDRSSKVPATTVAANSRQPAVPSTVAPTSAPPSSAAASSSPPSPSPSPTKATSRPPSSPPPSSPPPASPSESMVPPGGTGVIRGLATDLCLDSDSNPMMALNGTPSGGHAFSKTCSAAGSQQWSEGPLLSQDSPRADDLYRLVNRQTGFCLDGDDQHIYTLPCLNPDKYQTWQRVQPTSGRVAYRNQATSRCLSMSKADSTLKTQSCPTGSTWPDDMLFRRPS